MINQLIYSLIYLTEPIGFIWFLLLLGAIIFLKRKQWLAAIYCIFIAGIISLIGSTPAPGKLMETLERQYVRTNIYNLPTCDAVVSLGGSVQASKYDIYGLDIMFTGDRIFMAVELIKNGKAKNLVIGGSGYEVNGTKKVEPDMVKNWLEAWNLVNVPIYSLGSTENTHDEAIKTLELAKKLGWQSIIIVTSAYHMPRTAATFAKTGLNIVCVPCDFQTSISIETPVSYTLVPRYQGFMKLSLFIRETVGLIIYKLRGWA